MNDVTKDLKLTSFAAAWNGCLSVLPATGERVQLARSVSFYLVKAVVDIVINQGVGR